MRRSPLQLSALRERLGSRGLLLDPAQSRDELNRASDISSATTNDSRLVAPGGLFVAIPGAVHDGGTFAAEAVARGAVAVIATRRIDGLGVPLLLVRDAREALAEAAAWWEGDPAEGLITVGVTGTDGKTTTSTLLASALAGVGIPTGLVTTAIRRVGGRQSATPAHQTTPEAPELQKVLRAIADARDRAVVVEATSHGLALSRVGAIPFTAGILTNLTSDHLDFHGSVEAYHAAKLRLVDAIRSNDASRAAGLEPIIVLPADYAAAEPFVAAAAAAGIRVARFGIASDGALLINGVARRIELALPGRVNALNAAAALSLVDAWGLPIAPAMAAVAAETGPPGRAERIDVGQPFTVLVDFAHTGASMSAALEIARSLRAASGRILVVTGAAGERDPGRRTAIGAAVAIADAVWIADEDPRFEDPDRIATAIASAIEAERSGSAATTTIEHDRRAAIRAAIGEAKPGDVVLLAGKGHERTIERRGVDEPWDEAAVAREALRGLGYPRER